ncbi:MAG: T9SS type A sorting domain-containing protein [Lewinella sp.]|nr:T9SS type A sorting domain-containing protein [Lewinella sp.]
MKNVYFWLIAVLMILPFVGSAQINTDSPYPTIFEVLAPGNIAGSYGYGTQTYNADAPDSWGPILNETVSGELIWAYDDIDSLCCNTVITDLTGKMALIRRGECDFSQKVYNAQVAGAIGVVIVNHYDDPDNNANTLVGMLGVTNAADVTIPAIFISRATGELITGELDAGNPVTVSFTVNTFYNPVGSFSWHTPLSEAIEFDAFRVNFVNPSTTDPVEVTINATIIAPSGAQTSLTGTETVTPAADSVINMVGSYLPEEAGEYTVIYNNTLTDETVSTGFVMTDYTYALDNGDISLDAGPSSDLFISSNLLYQTANLVLCDEDGATVSFASFGLSNAAEVFTGDPDADQVAIVLYDADADDDGFLDFSTNPSFADLTQVAFGTYTITGNEGASELVTVQLEDLTDGDNQVELKGDGAYYISIAYDGTLAGTGIPPRFIASANIPYLNFPSTPLQLDQFYTGWADRTVAIRLHLDGFVGTRDVEALPAEKISIFPNPATDLINLRFDLDQPAERIDVGLLDMQGKLLSTYRFSTVDGAPVQIDINQLPTGTYFLSIITPEGYRAEKFIKQ